MHKRRRGIVAGLVTLVACLIAWSAQRHVASGWCCDMTWYIDQGLDFARNGLFESSHPLMSLRTYGYPYFVGLLSHASSGTPESVEVVVFLVQLALLLGVAWILAIIFGGALRSSRVGIYALIVLNPILLAATPAVLTDLVAALAASLAIALVFHDRGRLTWVALLSILLAS